LTNEHPNKRLIIEHDIRFSVINLWYFWYACIFHLFPLPALSALTLLVWHQKEHLACKNLSDKVVDVVICLERGADCLHMVQLMPLPSQNPIFSCIIYILTSFTFLVLAYPGCLGKETVKQV